jgi:hypothetical protein
VINLDKHSCEYTLDGLASALLCHWISGEKAGPCRPGFDLGPLHGGRAKLLGAAYDLHLVGTGHFMLFHPVHTKNTCEWGLSWQQGQYSTVPFDIYLMSTTAPRLLSHKQLCGCVWTVSRHD